MPEPEPDHTPRCVEVLQMCERTIERVDAFVDWIRSQTEGRDSEERWILIAALEAYCKTWLGELEPETRQAIRSLWKGTVTPQRRMTTTGTGTDRREVLETPDA